MYYFSPLYHAARLVYFAPIGAAFLFLKENKRLAAFLILLPMLLVWGMWKGFAAALGMPEEASGLDTVIIAFLTGITVVWLLGERIGNRHRFLTFLSACGILLGCCALMLFEIAASEYVKQILLVGVIGAGVMLSGFIVGGFLCRQRFGPVRFSVCFGAGVAAAILVVFSSVFVIQIGTYFSVDLLWMFLVMALIYTAIGYIGLLPFVVLLLVNGFWRRRFAAVMGIGRDPETSHKVSASGPVSA